MNSLKTMKQISGYALIFLFLVGCNAVNTENANEKKAIHDNDGYKLVWNDEFDYEGLPDSTKWNYDTEGNAHGWGNNEMQHYTVASLKNAFVGNGTLKIVAVKEAIEGKEFSSARLVSNADWKYGRIEVNAKLPEGRGTWAAIWMMPGNWTFNDGNWPDIGEFDIMEHVGHEKGVIHASAHSKDYQWQKGTQKTGIITVPDVTEKFHSYIWDWSPNIIKAYVDDSLYFEYRNEGLGESKWPYEKPFYLILNVAVGGAWGGMQGIDSAAFPQTMEMDYVRIYQKEE
jgi:beta-glucanase (GH16 family)